MFYFGCNSYRDFALLICIRASIHFYQARGLSLLRAPLRRLLWVSPVGRWSEAGRGEEGRRGRGRGEGRGGEGRGGVGRGGMGRAASSVAIREAGSGCIIT